MSLRSELMILTFFRVFFFPGVLHALSALFRRSTFLTAQTKCRSTFADPETFFPRHEFHMQTPAG
jgi:hypothetical protein